MKKKLLSITLALATTCSFAQLSERENDATMIKLGARPQAGNMALTFGFNFGGLVDTNETGAASLFTGNFFAQGDFLTFKYFNSDDLAIRFAIRLSRHSNKIKGDVADSSVYNLTNFGGTFESKTNDREYVLVPGIEKHFSNSNIFDVYTGADLYLGFGREDSVDSRVRSNGDFNKYEDKTTNKIVGVGGIVGFNLFVAHLPVSIGLEYGLNLKWEIGGKTKVNVDDKVGNVSTSAEYYLDSDDPNSLKYKKLKKSKFDMDTNQDVRLVLNIYFKQ